MPSTGMLAVSASPGIAVAFLVSMVVTDPMIVLLCPVLLSEDGASNDGKVKGGLKHFFE
ncbi:hypothetical protein D3C72_2027020 [compost metagenome]